MSSTSLRRALFAGLALGVFAQSAAAPVLARPLVPAEQRHMSFSGDIPACDDPSVLGKITSRFDHRESRYWQSGLSISGFNGIVEVGFRTPGLDFLPRRYCMAHAVFENGQSRKVTYAIAGDLGWLGVLGFGVEWCIDGLDRNLAYGGECRAARP